MKLKLIAVVALAVVSFNASAINAHYRAQLERSGCTQSNAGQGCDIHKTREENAKYLNHYAAKDPERAEIAAFVESVVLGNTISAAAENLLGYGFKPYNGVWKKGKYRLTLTVNDSQRVASADLK